jgi:hypothetical protein
MRIHKFCVQNFAGKITITALGMLQEIVTTAEISGSENFHQAKICKTDNSNTFPWRHTNHSSVCFTKLLLSDAESTTLQSTPSQK